MPEQTLGGIPLGLGMVMKINFLNFHGIKVNLLHWFHGQQILYTILSFNCFVLSERLNTLLCNSATINTKH